MVDQEVVALVAQVLLTLGSEQEAKEGTIVAVTQATFSLVEVIRAGKQQLLILSILSLS